VAAIPERAPIEAALSEAQLRALRENCAGLGVPFEHWPHVPALRGFAVLAATLHTVRELEAEGVSRTRAIGRTAARFGLNDKAVASLLSRSAEAGIRGPIRAA